MNAPRFLALFLWPAVSLPASGPALRLATWNMEWLASPATTLAARQACLAGAQRAALPCDTALDAARSSADLARLRHYAELTDADVIAFQEVEDAGTAARVFPGYAFCFTGSHTVQNLGFAIRRGLKFRCGPDHVGLATGPQGRRGAVLVLDPGGPRELQVLGVHLKSGCAQGEAEARGTACRQLARQLPLVGDWIREQARAGRRYVVMGDFNRSWSDADAARREITGPRTGGQDFDDPGLDAGFTSCFPGQTFTRYIDHLLVGRAGGLRTAPGSFFRVRFSPGDVRHYRLSDHCPTGVVLQFTASDAGPPRRPVGGIAY